MPMGGTVLDENAFRFVAVRPPQLDTARGTTLVHNEIADAVLGRILAKQKADTELPWSEAAAAVGAEIIADKSFWPATEVFLALGFNHADVTELIESASSNPDDHAAFMNRVQKWLDRAHPGRGKASEWIRTAEYGRVRNAAWTAWYGYVLSPHRPPQQESFLVQSILLLELLRAADDGTTFAAVADIMARQGPAIRPDLVLGPPGQTPPPPPLDNVGPQRHADNNERFPPNQRVADALAHGEQARDERIDPWLKEGITIIRQARAVVQAFFDVKLASPRRVRPYVTSVDAPGPEGLIGFEGVESQAPWRVSQAELERDPQLAEALTQIGFNRAGDTLPDALSRADNQIATWNTRLYARLRETRVGNSAGRPVRLVEQTRGEPGR
jgi:hypothetical protein